MKDYAAFAQEANYYPWIEGNQFHSVPIENSDKKVYHINNKTSLYEDTYLGEIGKDMAKDRNQAIFVNAPGHWVALFIEPKEQKIHFIDSLGHPIDYYKDMGDRPNVASIVKGQVEKYNQTNGTEYKVENFFDHTLQYDGVNCGRFAAATLYALDQGVPPEEFKRGNKRVNNAQKIMASYDFATTIHNKWFNRAATEEEKNVDIVQAVRDYNQKSFVEARTTSVEIPQQNMDQGLTDENRKDLKIIQESHRDTLKALEYAGNQEGAKELKDKLTQLQTVANNKDFAKAKEQYESSLEKIISKAVDDLYIEKQESPERNFSDQQVKPQPQRKSLVGAHRAAYNEGKKIDQKLDQDKNNGVINSIARQVSRIVNKVISKASSIKQKITRGLRGLRR